MKLIEFIKDDVGSEGIYHRYFIHCIGYFDETRKHHIGELIATEEQGELYPRQITLFYKTRKRFFTETIINNDYQEIKSSIHHELEKNISNINSYIIY